MAVYTRNDVDPDRFFSGDIGRVVEPGDTVEADTNPDWQYFDEEPSDPGDDGPPVDEEIPESPEPEPDPEPDE